MKRLDYLDWDTTFMAMAYLIAKRSKDPRSQVGSVIVNPDNIVVGLGYNGFPRGVDDDAWSWDNPEKHFAVVHAEANAILNSNQHPLKDCTIYTTMCVCSSCAKMIIQSGIKKVLFSEGKHLNRESMVAARKLFQLASVEYKQYAMNSCIIIQVSQQNNTMEDTKDHDHNIETHFFDKIVDEY